MPEEFNQEVVGTVGRVSVPIIAGQAGEVMLPIRKGVEAYSAIAEVNIAKNARVVVVEMVSNRTVFVTPC